MYHMQHGEFTGFLVAKKTVRIYLSICQQWFNNIPKLCFSHLLQVERYSLEEPFVLLGNLSDQCSLCWRSHPAKHLSDQVRSAT